MRVPCGQAAEWCGFGVLTVLSDAVVTVLSGGKCCILTVLIVAW
jgi:hypothetical protein